MVNLANLPMIKEVTGCRVYNGPDPLYMLGNMILMVPKSQWSQYGGWWCPGGCLTSGHLQPSRWPGLVGTTQVYSSVTVSLTGSRLRPPLPIMTSWHRPPHHWSFVMGTIGPLWWEPTGHRFHVYLMSAWKKLPNKLQMNWDVITLIWRHCNAIITQLAFDSTKHLDLHNIPTSNGSWCIGIKGEMSGTVCVTFTWDIYIYMSCL